LEYKEDGGVTGKSLVEKAETDNCNLSAQVKEEGLKNRIIVISTRI